MKLQMKTVYVSFKSRTDEDKVYFAQSMLAPTADSKPCVVCGYRSEKDGTGYSEIIPLYRNVNFHDVLDDCFKDKSGRDYDLSNRNHLEKWLLGMIVDKYGIEEVVNQYWYNK